MYGKFRRERDLFTARIADLQEDTLMGMATCKDMQRWFEKAHQALERIDYISEIQKGRDSEEHGIRVLMDSSITRIRKAVRTLGVHGPRASAKNARKVGRMREKLGENQPGNEGH
jgi:hypothetical protein